MMSRCSLADFLTETAVKKHGLVNPPVSLKKTAGKK